MYNRRPQQFSRSYDDGSGNSLFMNISSSCVGAIIGRKGSRIREMEETSGARIKIHDNDSGDRGERRIEIMGNPDSQDAAKSMIEQVLDGTFQDDYGGGGGGGGGGRYGGGGGGRYGGGGGGGRYGGGGGGGGGNCFRCGEGGHFARDCTSSSGGGGGGGGGGGRGRSYGGGGGGGGGGGCYKCGQHGHFARECNNSDSYGGSRGGSRGNNGY